MSGLLPNSGVWETVLCAPTPLVNVAVQGSQHSLHETAPRLPSHIPGESYLGLERVMTVLTGSERLQGECRQRQDLGNDSVHNRTMA